LKKGQAKNKKGEYKMGQNSDKLNKKGKKNLIYIRTPY